MESMVNMCARNMEATIHLPATTLKPTGPTGMFATQIAMAFSLTHVFWEQFATLTPMVISMVVVACVEHAHWQKQPPMVTVFVHKLVVSTGHAEPQMCVQIP
jgi:hypothetical protein